MSRRRRQPDLRAQLADAKEREQKAAEAARLAFQSQFDLAMERQRLERAVQFDDEMLLAISDLELKAANADDEAQAAEQRAEHRRREADGVKLDPVHVASVDAGLAAAHERVHALAQKLDDSIIAGKPDAALQRIVRQQEDASATARALEAEQSVLAELAASADRLRDEAAAHSAAATEARDRAAQHRAAAQEVPEVARQMAINAWHEEQRLAKLQPTRKPTQVPPPVLVSNGKFITNLQTGEIYDPETGQPISAAWVA